MTKPAGPPTPRHTDPAPRRRTLRGLAWALGLGALLATVPAAPGLPGLPGGTALGQGLNFKPLERGDYSEVEERLVVARGLNVGAAYAFRFTVNRQQDLPRALQGTNMDHDLRLNLDTVFDRDVHLHLGLELAARDFAATQSRQSTSDPLGRHEDSLPTALNAREAYLRYNFNPNSGLIFGKQELSLGDRRGRTLDALVPGITFDCRIGTWCMPFGFALLGPYNSDALVHWALQYTAWDTQADGFPQRLQVEVFRIRYHENNVPLGKNLGPARYNPSDPGGGSAPTAPDASQALQPDGNPLYYDAVAQDYYGFRVDWQSGNYFANFDVVAYRGVRAYHLYLNPAAPLPGTLDATGNSASEQGVKGSSLETEAGYRWGKGRAGLRIMSATGDDYSAYGSGQNYTRGLRGYFEIVPGAYQGTRLYFNGTRSTVDQGAGLGHSVNNTRVIGMFVDWADPERRRFGYSGGVYQLSLNKAIPDSDSNLQRRIGVEWDNRVTWFAHRAVRFEAEANAIFTGGAFRTTDYGTPDVTQKNFYQAIGRVVYSF